MMPKLYISVGACRLLAGLLIALLPGTVRAQNNPAAVAAAPMQFEWVREAPPEVCRDHCREWISASGTIVDATPREFAAFAKDREVHGAVVVLNSMGGAVAKGLELGREFRRLGVATAVGSTVKLEGNRGAAILSRASCNSMCVFLLMGGIKRYVPEDARILVHQVWPSSNREDANAAVYSAGTMVATQRILGEIAQYVVEMGADIELFRIATRVPPWENLRPLTRDELRRLRVHNGDDLPGALPFSSSVGAMPAAAAPVVSSPAAPGWTIGRKMDQQALVRQHPLTIEGEQIGMFEISFLCGEARGTYRVEYLEKRLAQAASDARLDAVGISAARERVMLKVETSQPGQPATELVSLARGIVSARFMDALAAGGNQPLVVATSTTSNVRTTIRIGRAGLPENLPRMTAACLQ